MQACSREGSSLKQKFFQDRRAGEFGVKQYAAKNNERDGLVRNGALWTYLRKCASPTLRFSKNLERKRAADGSISIARTGKWGDAAVARAADAES